MDKQKELISELISLFSEYGYDLSRDKYRTLPNKPAATSTLEKTFGSWSDLKDLIMMESCDSHPKILLFDVETSPMEVLVWGLYKQRISPDNVIKDWALLSWSAKWLFEPEIYSQVVTPQEAIDRKDGSIIKGLWDLIDEATVIIAHNLDRFDRRKANARFIENRLTPPLPYQMIDTLKVAKKNFAFSSYRLDYINSLFSLRKKDDTNFQLWKDCIAGKAEALAKMRSYNETDVIALEELYVLLRPWMNSHPNLGLFVESEDSVCPTCASNELIWKGYYTTPTGKYRSFRCKECGAIGRSRFTCIPKDERKKIVVSTAR